jgi:quercetin dioxygenase-like cupin family protein
MKKKIPHCDFDNQQTVNVRETINKIRLYKYKGNFTWKGIKTEKYKTGGTDWKNIIRKVLIGNHNESTKFHIRYFEIASGGYSSFEKHRHEHVVIGIRGKGMVLCSKSGSSRTEMNYQLNFLDILYIAPNTPHQLSNPFHEPFGFLCIVNAKRDRPKILTKFK